MSNKIKVGKSLSKFDWYEKLDVHSKMYARNAVKEIVEAVIDKCAEEAGYHPYNEDDRMAYINKDSILNVRNMIDYE